MAEDLLNTAEPAPGIPDDFKRLRTTSLPAFTRYINKIETWIEDNVSRKVLRAARPEFEDFVNACLDANLAYNNCAAHSADELQCIKNWRS